jgi:hypothetical protein
MVDFPLRKPQEREQVHGEGDQGRRDVIQTSVRCSTFAISEGVSIGGDPGAIDTGSSKGTRYLSVKTDTGP